MEFSNEMITVDDFCEKANITKAHARQLLREQKLKGIKVGKEWRISSDEVFSYLGIATDINKVEREMYIKELENKVRVLEDKVVVAQKLIGTLSGIL